MNQLQNVPLGLIQNVKHHPVDEHDYLKCESPQVVLCIRTASNGIHSAVLQCQSCGASFVTKMMFVVDRSILPPYNSEIQSRQWKEAYERNDAARARDKAQQSKEWWDLYNAYLKTEDWQWLRKLVLKRADGMCEGCGISNATQVHHLTYEHVRSEFLWELRAVCNDCHERLHAGEL